MEIEYNDLISKEYKGKDPDLKVIKTDDMQLIIDYPLSKPFTFNIISIELLVLNFSNIYLRYFDGI